MTAIVLTTGGQMVDLDAYIHGDTIGTLAHAVAADVYNNGDPLEDAVFSFKVDGVVLEPNVAEPTFAEGQVLELVDVTDHDFTPPEAVVAIDPDAVPDGTVDEVIAWVEGDQQRAIRALDAEQARPKKVQRSSLVAYLEPLVNVADPSGA